MRIVEPAGLIGTHHGWYLVAWDRLRQAPRTFRLDRIMQVTPTGEAIVPRPLDALLLEIPLDFAEPTLHEQSGNVLFRAWEFPTPRCRHPLIP